MDLIFVSAYLASSNRIDLLLVARSDHMLSSQIDWQITNAQLLQLRIDLPSNTLCQRKIIDIQHLNYLLSDVGWELFFTGCDNNDDYASRFTSLLQNSIYPSTH